MAAAALWCPKMVVAQIERKPLVVEEWHSDVGLEFDYYRDETQSRDGARTVLERSIFTQMLGLDFEGYSLDPRLLRYQLNLDIEHDFLDETFDTPVESFIPRHTSSNGYRINYDLFLHFLPQNRESFSVWARRRDYRLTELLFDRFEIEEDVYGARFDSKWSFAPFSIMVERRESDETGLFDRTHDESDTLRFDLRKPLPADRGNFDFEYEYTDRTRVTEGEMRSPERLQIDEKTHWADAFLEYKFGPQRLSSSLSRISYLDQNGTFPYQNFLARERVILHHSPRLRTDYGVVYQDSEYNVNSIETVEADARLQHRLYDNLISRFEARVRHTDEESVERDDVQLLGNWNYWRHTSLGRSAINYLISHTSRDSDAPVDVSSQLTNRLELRHDFRFPLQVYYRLLDQRQDVDKAVGFAITDSTEQTLGYEVPWRRWRWYQEKYHLDDTLGKIDSFRSGVDGYFTLPYQSQLNFGVNYDDTDYHGRLEDSQTLNGRVGLLVPFGYTGLFQLDALYQDYEGIQDEALWRLDSSLGFDWRELKFRFTGKYGFFDNRRAGFERKTVQLLFTVRRDLR